MEPLDIDKVQADLKTKKIGRSIIHEMTCDSTMNIARSEAQDGASHGTIVVAEEQTSGRGRFGRSWTSPPGENLYLTLILRPPLQRLRSLSMIAPLAVCLAAEDVTGVAAGIKWPNDVLVGGRKLSGILVESEVSGDDVRFALVGIGVNVNFDPDADDEIREIATSLMRERGRQVSREATLAGLLNRFEQLYESPVKSIVEAWRSRLETLGRPVKLSLGDKVYEGVAEGVDEAGSLVLRCPDGSTMTFEAGEVSLRDPDST
jgi:BirA family biotin operon repressor/biotin-[acetyl-CoA-carboxylase] ligase